MKLCIHVALQIQKSVGEVFNAIIDPIHMSQYFISKSSGKMEEDQNLIWYFPEFEEEAPIRVGKMITDKLITFYWDIDGVEVMVEINLEARQDGSTVVRIEEKGMDNNEAGINWLKGNTEGWSNFLACLKAYLEYGVNLRRGAFEYRFEKIKEV